MPTAIVVAMSGCVRTRRAPYARCHGWGVPGSVEKGVYVFTPVGSFINIGVDVIASAEDYVLMCGPGSSPQGPLASDSLAYTKTRLLAAQEAPLVPPS